MLRQLYSVATSKIVISKERFVRNPDDFYRGIIPISPYSFIQCEEGTKLKTQIEKLKVKNFVNSFTCKECEEESG
jgi:hypothetical protein